MKITRNEIRENLKLIIEKEEKSSLMSMLSSFSIAKFGISLLYKLYSKGGAGWETIKAIDLFNKIKVTEETATPVGYTIVQSDYVKKGLFLDSSNNELDIDFIYLLIKFEGGFTRHATLHIFDKDLIKKYTNDQKIINTSSIESEIIKKIAQSLGYIFKYLKYENVKKAISSNDKIKEGLNYYLNTPHNYLISSDNAEVEFKKVKYLNGKFSVFKPDGDGLYAAMSSILTVPDHSLEQADIVKQAHYRDNHLFVTAKSDTSLQTYYHELLHCFYFCIYPKDIDSLNPSNSNSSGSTGSNNPLGVHLSSLDNYFENGKKIYEKFIGVTEDEAKAFSNDREYNGPDHAYYYYVIENIKNNNKKIDPAVEKQKTGEYMTEFLQDKGIKVASGGLLDYHNTSGYMFNKQHYSLSANTLISIINEKVGNVTDYESEMKKLLNLEYPEASYTNQRFSQMFFRIYLALDSDKVEENAKILAQRSKFVKAIKPKKLDIPDGKKKKSIPDEKSQETFLAESISFKIDRRTLNRLIKENLFKYF